MKVENLIQSEAYYYGRDIENNVKGEVVQYLYHTGSGRYSFTDNSQNGEFELTEEDVEKYIQEIDEVKPHVFEKRYEKQLSELQKDYNNKLEWLDQTVKITPEVSKYVHLSYYDLISLVIKSRKILSDIRERDLSDKAIADAILLSVKEQLQKVPT